MPRIYHVDDGQFGEPYKCEHDVSVSIDDGILPSRCEECHSLRTEWEEQLKRLHLGMHQGIKENTVSFDSHPAFAEGKMPGLLSHEEQKTVNTEVPKRDNNVKVWPSIKPPRNANIRSLLSRLDELSQQIVTMRILEGFSMPEIAEHFGLNVKTIYNRYNAAIDLMREPEAPEYSDNLTCTFCKTSFPRHKKGPPARFCSDRCQIRGYRATHGRKDYERCGNQSQRAGRTQAAA